jgi:hypothetical protein
MTAPDAHVLVQAIALGQAYIRVMPKKAGERVAHMRGLAILPQVLRATAAVRDGSGHPPQHLVVDDVAPEGATETHPARRTSGGILHVDQCVFWRLAGSTGYQKLPGTVVQRQGDS